MSPEEIQIFEVANNFIGFSKARDKTYEQVVEAFRQAIQLMGFDYFCVASFADERALPEDAILVVDYPIEWAHHYHRNNYKRFDPVVIRAANDIMPFSWDDDQLMDGITSYQRLIMNEAQDIGFLHGLTIPVHAPNCRPAAVNVVSLMGGADIHPSSRNALHLMSIYLYGFLEEHRAELKGRRLNRLFRKPVSLSQREREILQLLADGKGLADIAEATSLGVSGIKYHLENIRKKYGVVKNIQSVVHATLEGHIIK